MSSNPNQQADRLKQALTEIRANRQHFSEASFSQIVMLMLEKLRQIQTATLEDSPTDDEIRLVTVMFIDVKDSTEMLQHLDASDWKIIIDTAHEQIADIVMQWDGQVGQYLGDGVLCFFGAQRSHGDDALHAVSCALQIQSVLEQYAKNVFELHNIDFGLRIGISTGRVVVGLIGSHTVKQELLALGPATNLAARLQSVAPVGSVLIDSTTYNRIRRNFVTRAETPVELRGFEKAINNYHVLGRRTQPASQFTDTHVAGIELPLVGRDEDLALISHLCDRALKEKNCQVVTLSGDVGMGKSRLLQEIIHLTGGHFTHIVMTSQYESRSKSQNLLREMLMTQCQLSDDMPLAMKFQQIEAYINETWEHEDAISTAQAIAFLAGFDVEPPDDKPEEWVLRWFEGVSQNTPIVIIVDNLQWIDTRSIQLLERIAECLKDSSCVIICAGRPEYKSAHPDYMLENPEYTILQLESLSSEATMSIISTVFSNVERVPSHLAGAINERVEGNPLFVQEYLRMLFDNNVFKTNNEGGWRFNIIMMDTALNNLPNGLLGILQARLDDLPDRARQAIQVATISGQKFWESSISALLDIDDPTTLIQHLVTRDMIVLDKYSLFEDESQYHFRYSLYRDVAYEMIPRAKREDYHKQMASWLMERIAGNIQYYPLLAEQFAESGEHLAALYTYAESVEMQIKQKNELKALSLIGKALSLANQVDRDDALAVVAKLWAYQAEALVTLERYEEASASSQSSLRLLLELPDEQLIASRISSERILGLAYLSLGRYTDSYDALTRAYSLLSRTDIEQITTVLLAMGKLYYYQGRLQDSLAYYRRAYENANKMQQLDLISVTLTNISLIDIELGSFAEALQNLNESVKIARSLQLEAGQANALFLIGIIHLGMLDYGKAYDYFSEAENINIGFGYVNLLIQGYRAFTLVALGRTLQGKALLSDAIRQAPRDADMQHQLQLVSISTHAILEDYVQVRDKALAFIAEEGVNPILQARAYRWLGFVSHNFGDNGAIDYLHSAVELESSYAGRDSWLNYATFALCVNNPDEESEFYRKSAQLIIERANTLREYSDMRESFLENSFIQKILNEAGMNNSLSG